MRRPIHPPAAVVAVMLLIGVVQDPGALRGEESAPPAVGAQHNVGCKSDPRRVQRLSITKPGVYENILVDGEWTDGTLVKITADGVTLRNCEIRHGRHNAVTVNAKDVVIESCRIHHVLAGTYSDQQDAHGITGRPNNLTIRNCEIGLTSGDAVQFDPGRGAWDNVLLENCTLWTGPLSADAAGFKKGQRPGENAVDTKQRTANPRSRMRIRNCLMYGWNQPSQISNMAALNLKNHVDVHVEHCVFRDCEICLRVRGGKGEYGGALVMIENCAVYNSQVAIRAEDGVVLKVKQLGLGDGVGQALVSVEGGMGSGSEYTGQFLPPAFEEAVRRGVTR